MKIKLSKSQWEVVGKKAGWSKTDKIAQTTQIKSSSIVEIDRLIGILNELKDAVNYHNTSGEDKEMNADFIRRSVENAKNAIKDVSGTIKIEILDAVSARQDDNPQPALKELKDIGIR